MWASILETIRKAEMAAAGTLLCLIVALVVVASIGRYFGSPVIWAIEVTQAAYVWLCIFAADLTLKKAGHFSVDMLANFLPAGARRTLEIANVLIAGAMIAALVYYGYLFAKVTGMRPLPITGLSSAVATAALPVGFALLLITMVDHLFKRLRGQDIRPADDEAREVM
ncbi:MAG: TRAP transporter small permease [Alphaproteobacteria bacterium]|nr:TRAP transporter small permease [Alphaproteobacteria bacterium]MCA0448411.1 TRAP transporter small permease [Pseudomonadota bacterium]